jgi:phage-related protein (TIGR01555 family)
MANPTWKKGGPSPNPNGRRGKQARSDAWENSGTGFGTTRDKQSPSYISFTVDTVTRDAARDLWRGDDLSAKAIEMIPDHALRQGFDIEIAGTEDAESMSEAIGGALEDLGAFEALRMAGCYERAYGGGAILVGADDGRPVDQPLDLERVRAVRYLTTLEPQELRPATYYANPLAPKFDQPATFYLNAQSRGLSDMPGVAGPITVHESRLVIFPGTRVSRDQVDGTETGWGDSVLTRLKRIFADYNLSFSSASVLLSDFAQAVIKMEGLAKAMASSRGQTIRDRMILMDQGRSTLRSILLDTTEDFERKTTSLAGMPELLDRMANRVATAVGIPVTLLTGQAPAGLNATGAADTRAFYDTVQAYRTSRLTPAIDRLVRMVMRSLRYLEPVKWSVAWPSLWQMTAQEKAEVRKVHAEADTLEINASIITPEEARKSRHGGDAWGERIVIDEETDDAAAEIDEANDPEALESDATTGAATPSGAPSGAAPAAEPAKQAMTGVQVTSLVDVVKAAANGEISRESAAAILALAFPLSPEEADRLLGPVTFKPKKEDPPPMTRAPFPPAGDAP